MYDHEDVYDEQVAPLMTQIIGICKAYGIPMIASFAYRADGPNDASYCSTYLEPSEHGFDYTAPERYEQMRAIMLRGTSV